jgi:hypothetical protein
MFIRQTQTRPNSTGASYFTYRLVESRRLGKKVSQHTLLNLGTNFELPAEAWPELWTRVEQILRSEEPLFAVDAAIEHTAQHIYSQIIARRGELSSLEIGQTEEFEEFDVNSLQLITPRTVGAEHVSLEALKELQIPEILEEAEWLKETSALGELLKHDFTPMPLMQLYRASDRLLRHKALIEEKIFGRVQDIFSFTPTITLYDLTNTYMEGGADQNPKANRYRSKEKRSDNPLLTPCSII